MARSARSEGRDDADENPGFPSYGDAQRCSWHWRSARACDWRGACDQYSIGSGPARVHLSSLRRSPRRPQRDRAEAGLQYPDDGGRARNPPTVGQMARRPASGMSAALEEARALGEMVKRAGVRSERSLCGGTGRGKKARSRGWKITSRSARPGRRFWHNTDSKGRGFAVWAARTRSKSW